MEIIRNAAKFEDVKGYFRYDGESNVTKIICGDDPDLGFALPFLVVDDRYLIGLDLHRVLENVADLALSFEHLEFQTEEEFEQHITRLKEYLVIGSPPIEDYNRTDLEFEDTLRYIDVDRHNARDIYREIEDDVAAIIDRVGYNKFYAKNNGNYAVSYGCQVPADIIDDSNCDIDATHDDIITSWAMITEIYSIPDMPVFIATAANDSGCCENFYIGLDLTDYNELRFGIVNRDFIDTESSEKYYSKMRSIQNEVLSGKRTITITHAFGILKALEGVACDRTQVMGIIDALYPMWQKPGTTNKTWEEGECHKYLAGHADQWGPKQSDYKESSDDRVWLPSHHEEENK